MMPLEEAVMETLWLLKGGYDAPGWKNLERDARAEEIDVVLFDRTAWALVNSADPPQGYDGMVPTEPPDGMYIDPNGRPLYLVDRQEVRSPEEVLAALGPEAKVMLDKVKDPVTALERLGRTF
jgi:hypothetical protein